MNDLFLLIFPILKEFCLNPFRYCTYSVYFNQFNLGSYFDFDHVGVLLKTFNLKIAQFKQETKACHEDSKLQSWRFIFLIQLISLFLSL